MEEPVILADTLSGVPPLDPEMLAEDQDLSDHESALGHDAVSVSDDEPRAPAPAKETPPPVKPAAKTPQKQGKKRPRGPEGELVSLLKERREQTGEAELKKIKMQCDSQERMQTERFKFEEARDKRQQEFMKSLLEIAKKSN